MIETQEITKLFLFTCSAAFVTKLGLYNIKEISGLFSTQMHGGYLDNIARKPHHSKSYVMCMNLIKFIVNFSSQAVFFGALYLALLVLFFSPNAHSLNTGEVAIIFMAAVLLFAPSIFTQIKVILKGTYPATNPFG